jgi:hypothetical protein
VRGASVRREQSTAAVAAVLFLTTAASAYAQDTTVRDVLSVLVTNQLVQTGDFVKDRAAAEATSNTIARALLVELATLPISTSSGGFTYRLNPSLSTVERVSQTFGPLFVDRAVTAGRGQSSVGLAYRRTSFSKLDGRDLRDGTFVTTANRFLGDSAPFDVEALNLRLSTSTVTLVGNYGITDHLDVGAAVPFVALRLDGERTNTYNGESFVQARGRSTATGLADIAVRAKYQVISAGPQGLAAGIEVRLPTGSVEDVRGAGDPGVKLSAIGSVGRGNLESHFNASFAKGGLSRETGFAAAGVWAATLRLTVSAELLVRRIQALGRITEVAEPHPTLSGIDTIRLLSIGENATTSVAVFGAKWNVGRTLLLSAYALVPVGNRGLRPGFTPMVSLDYAITR